MFNVELVGGRQPPFCLQPLIFYPGPKPAPTFARFAIGKQARNQEARAIIQEKTHQLAVRAALVP